MSQSICVSVITPFYKGNAYMEQLFSVIEQNSLRLKEAVADATLELIVVNDSPEVAVELPAKEVSFSCTVVPHEKNAGIHQARVTGLGRCRGDYILFLDQDDVLAPDAVAVLLKTALEQSSDLVIANADMETADGGAYRLYRTKTEFRQINDLGYYLNSHNVIKSPGQCLIAKARIPDAWTRFIMKRNGSDDLFLWLLLLEQGCRFTVVNQVLYVHKYTGENLSESGTKMNVSTLEIVDFLKQIPYVPAKDIRKLQRSRSFWLTYRKSGGLKKLCLLVKNADLICYLTWNKLKKTLY